MRDFSKRFQANVIFEMRIRAGTIFLYGSLGFLTAIPHAVV